MVNLSATCSWINIRVDPRKQHSNQTIRSEGQVSSLCEVYSYKPGLLASTSVLFTYFPRFLGLGLHFQTEMLFQDQQNS